MAESESGKVPIGEVVTASWRFLSDNWRLLLPAALMTAVVCGVAPVLLGAGATPGGDLRSYVVTGAAQVFFAAAVLRKALRNEFIAPIGIAFGMDELRLFGVLGCTLLLFAIPAGLYLVVFGFVLAGRSDLSEQELQKMQNDPEAAAKFFADALASPAGTVLAIIGLAGLVLLIYFAVRLTMTNAATLNEKRVVFLQSWSWSRGNVCRILAAILLTTLPVIFATTIVLAILAPFSSASPVSVAIVETIVSLVSVLGSVPSTVLGANLFKGLRPPDFVAK